MSRLLPLLLLLSACSTTRDVRLTISNATPRKERIRATVRDVARGTTLFERTALLLPGDAP
jgi:hypothetical protein